ncbi:MAG: hypothetical protein CL676_05430 [Bdellovibrionaceae bacterium]|nr:hypothetical protein [Pseudobdellovibrionaceae bacterium]
MAYQLADAPTGKIVNPLFGAKSWKWQGKIKATTQIIPKKPLKNARKMSFSRRCGPLVSRGG